MGLKVHRKISVVCKVEIYIMGFSEVWKIGYEYFWVSNNMIVVVKNILLNIFNTNEGKISLSCIIRAGVDGAMDVAHDIVDFKLALI